MLAVRNGGRSGPRGRVPRDSRAAIAREIARRTLLGVGGGYGSVWGGSALFSSLLARVGALSRADAVLVATNLALLAYPVLIVWAFGARRLGSLLLVCATLTLGGAVAVGAA